MRLRHDRVPAGARKRFTREVRHVDRRPTLERARGPRARSRAMNRRIVATLAAVVLTFAGTGPASGNAADPFMDFGWIWPVGHRSSRLHGR